MAGHATRPRPAALRPTIRMRDARRSPSARPEERQPARTSVCPICGSLVTEGRTILHLGTPYCSFTCLSTVGSVPGLYLG